MKRQTKIVEERFWGELTEVGRQEVATHIAKQILDRPYGQLDVGCLVPLADVFLNGQTKIEELKDENRILNRYGPTDED